MNVGRYLIYVDVEAASSEAISCMNLIYITCLELDVVLKRASIAPSA